MDAMTQLHDLFKQKYREGAEAEVVRAQLDKRRRTESTQQRRLFGMYTKYQTLSAGVGEQLSNIENMDKTIDNKIVGLHKAQTLMLDQTNKLHRQVKTKENDLRKVKLRDPVTTHAEIDTIKQHIDESDKENRHKRHSIRGTRSRVENTESDITKTKATILGERNRQNGLQRDDAVLNKQNSEQEEHEKELAREFRALEAVMQVQADTKSNLDASLETLASELDELRRAADTSNNEEYKNLKAEIKAKNLQQRNAVRLKQKLQAESERAEVDFSALKPDLDKVTASYEQHKAAVEKVSTECDAIEKQNADIESDLKQKQEQLQEFTDAHETFADENSVAQFEKELRKWKAQTTRNEKKTDTAEAKLEKVRADLTALETSIVAQSGDGGAAVQRSEEYQELAREVEAKNTAISEYEQQVKDSEESLQEQTKLREEIQSELEGVMKDLEALEQDYAAQESKLESGQNEEATRRSNTQKIEELQSEMEKEAEEEEERLRQYEKANAERQQQFEESISQLESAHHEHLQDLEAMFEKQKQRKQKLTDEFKAQNEAHERQKSEVAEKIREIEKELQRMEDDQELCA